MFLKISIRQKILLTFAIFIFVSAWVSFFGYYNFNTLNQKIQIIAKKDTLFNTVLEARRYEKNFFITLDPSHLNAATQYALQALKKLTHLIQEHKSYAASHHLDQQLILIQEYVTALKDLELSLKGVQKATGLKNQILVQAQDKIRRKGRACTVVMEKALRKERALIKDLINESRLYLFLTLGSILGIAMITLLFLLINVNTPLKRIEHAIKKIVKGDYKNIPPIKTGDEFESLAKSLNNLLSEMQRRSEQLVQSEKMAALGTLTSGVAHELNNPLNNISTSLQILLEELEEGDLDYQRQLLSEAEAQVDRAQDIVKSLLEFSRETSFSLTKENIKELVENTLKLIQGELPGKINIHTAIPPDLTGQMDPRRMQQVILNLLLNAIQAMNEQGGDIWIKANYDPASQGVICQVEDNGPGIPPDILPKIFDPFFTTKDVGKGSGLGLSVSQGIVEQHGGQIKVRSRPGQGTNFEIFLPDAR